MKGYCDSFTSFLKGLVISIQLHLISSISSPVFRYDALISCVIYVVGYNHALIREVCRNGVQNVTHLLKCKKEWGLGSVPVNT